MSKTFLSSLEINILKFFSIRFATGCQDNCYQYDLSKFNSYQFRELIEWHLQISLLGKNFNLKLLPAFPFKVQISGNLLSKNIFEPLQKNFHVTLKIFYNTKEQKEPPDVFYKKDPPKNFKNWQVTPQTSCLWPATLLKKRLWHKYFPVNSAKFLRTHFL